MARTRSAPFILAASLAVVEPASARDTSFSSTLETNIPGLMALYRDLHEHPELSAQEQRTAARLADIMRNLGFAVTEHVGGSGVVAVLENGPGPTVMLRTDMDALPMTERTGLPFASKVNATNRSGEITGVMHACGHDTHMAGWVGAAELLVAHRGSWSGTLLMIAQPAEEVGEGAAAMLADGLFDRFPKPNYAIAFHNSAQLPAGIIGYSSGYALANVDTVDILVRGVGGHGAYPHMAKDPVVLASAIVTRLQTLVSREQDPQDAAVVTVGSIHGGTKHNIIPDEVTLQLTVRSYSDSSRQALLDGIRRISRGEAIAAGMPENTMPVVTEADRYTPATYNDPELIEQLLPMLHDRFGRDHVIETPAALAGEDFGRYRRADERNIRSVIFWVGGVPQADWELAQAGQKALPSLHSPFWAPDAETVVRTGEMLLTNAALELFDTAD